MWTNGRRFVTRVLAVALLALMSFAQPALAQGQPVSVGETVTRVNTDAAQQFGAQGYHRGCNYDEYYYCDPHGDRGRGDHRRGGHGRGGHGHGRGGRR